MKLIKNMFSYEYRMIADYSKSVNLQMDVNKRAVFKRLGDDISQPSVTSTTAFDEDEQNMFAAKKLKDDTAKVSQEKVRNIY